MGFAFEAADFFDGVIDQFDDVELVEGDGGIGEIGGHAFGKGLRHIGA